MPVMNELKSRHEFKYRCTEAQLFVLKNRIDHCLSLDSHANSDGYTIRSMYFDNYTNRCYYENENGTDPREKFRIRIYNADPSRITLECKRKEHTKTIKTSCRLSMEQYEKILNRTCPFSGNEEDAVLNKFLYLQKTQGMNPAVIVEYDRIPYICSAGNVRITLDRNIRSSRSFSNFFDPVIPSRPLMPASQHLLEVKYDELLPDYIKDLLQLDSLQQTTFSKYYLCRKYSFGGLL